MSFLKKKMPRSVAVEIKFFFKGLQETFMLSLSKIGVHFIGVEVELLRKCFLHVPEIRTHKIPKN